jgi:5-methylcytosine-specific restriction endonuclease McrA
MPKVNARQQAKKAAKYKAFLSSAVWKRLRREALERAGHRCEWISWGHERGVPPTSLEFMDLARCPATEKLTVHHVTYARFGGAELPEDLRVLCKHCHDRHHALEGKRIA